MVVSGKFVMISVSEREYNGKKYYSASVEDTDTGKILSFDADVSIVPQVVKYKEFLGFFEVSQYGKDTRLRLFDLRAINNQKEE